MLDLPHTMAVFASSAFTVDDVDAKFNATHLDGKPQAVQIIQLVECSPPPRRIISESLYSSSASSSYYSEEEEQSECSSYCSSLESEPEPEAEQPSPELVYTAPSTYNLRMKRILAWRQDFSSHLSATLSNEHDSSISHSLKRKMAAHDDVLSHTSKRSRSQSSRAQAASNCSSSRAEAASSCSSLGALSCPACDASFDTRQDLRQHGHDARVGANEACFVAVDYAFE